MSTTQVSFSELEAAAKPAPAVEPQATPAATEATPATPQFTEADAQALRTLADLGITPQNAQEFIQAKSALANLPALLRSNPKTVLAEIAKNDPEAYNAVLESASDEWYEKYVREHPESQTTNGSPSRTATSHDPRIDQLQSQVASFIAERNQEKSERQQANMVSSYNKAIGELMGKLPDGVPSTAKEFIELKTQRLIWQDPQARDRVSKGVYVDVPKYFAQASAQATADIKAAASSEHGARQAVEARGNREIVPAAEAVNGQAGDRPNEDPIWGSSGLARDVQAALKQK